MENGNAYFKQRFDKIKNGKAEHTAIDRAINHYMNAPGSEEKFITLLQCYKLKGSLTNISDEDIRKSFKKGLELGERIKDDYPSSPGIWYWYIANLSRWGDHIPITEAADEGILEELKNVTEQIIEMDPAHEKGGALRLLGGVHLKAPIIPFVLTWPSEDKAQALLNRAYDIAPENAANTYYYILMLRNEDKRSIAETALKEFMNRKPRDAY